MVIKLSKKKIEKAIELDALLSSRNIKKHFLHWLHCSIPAHRPTRSKAYADITRVVTIFRQKSFT